MEELVREIQTLQAELGWHEWSNDPEVDHEYLVRRLMAALDLMITLARNVRVEVSS